MGREIAATVINSDHVYFVHPTTDALVDISTDTWPMTDVLVDILTDMSVDISTDTQPIYRPRYVGRDIRQVLVNISTDYQPITVGGISVDCRWHIGRLSCIIIHQIFLLARK